MSVNKRITRLRKSKKLTQQDLATRLGISRQTVHNIEKDKHSASSDILTKILLRFEDISPKWLILGEGNMYLKNIDIVEEPIDEYATKYQEKLIESLERENAFLREELERLKKEKGE